MRENVVYGDGGVAEVDLIDEYKAFDQLGPITREAINEASFKVCAQSILHKAIAMGIDPLDPSTDASIAKAVQIKSEQAHALHKANLSSQYESDNASRV